MDRRPPKIHTPAPVDNSSIERIEHACEAQARCGGCIKHSVTYQGLTMFITLNSHKESWGNIDQE